MIWLCNLKTDCFDFVLPETNEKLTLTFSEEISEVEFLEFIWVTKVNHTINGTSLEVEVTTPNDPITLYDAIKFKITDTNWLVSDEMSIDIEVEDMWGFLPPPLPTF